VRQRTREIGLRIALKVTRRDIVWLVRRQGAGTAVLGPTIGLGVGFIVARLLTGLLSGISASGPMTLAAAGGVLLATTMPACYPDAHR